MLKLQTEVSNFKMSNYSTNQHSTPTTIKSIAFKQNYEGNQGRFILLLDLLTVAQRQNKSDIYCYKLGRFKYSQ
jgi:hypothetical protein